MDCDGGYVSQIRPLSPQLLLVLFFLAAVESKVRHLADMLADGGASRKFYNIRSSWRRSWSCVGRRLEGAGDEEEAGDWRYSSGAWCLCSMGEVLGLILRQNNKEKRKRLIS